MALDDGQKRAIARVDVWNGNKHVSRGTAFVIAPGKVLTAAHVIALENGAALGDSIWLTFGTDVDWPAGIKTEVKAEVASAGTPARQLLDRAADWAILSCEVPAGAVTMELDRLRVGYKDPHWSSFGYTEATQVGQERGLPYDGTINDPGSRSFTLFCTQAAAGGGSDVSGLSGAPCMVHGRVVALIRGAELSEGTEGKKKSVEGRIYAVPIQSIAAACPEAVSLAEPAQIPYEGQLRDALGEQKGMLESIGDKLRIQRSRWETHADLKSLIARELYRRGLKGTVNIAIAHFDDLRDGIERLVDLAETFWVPDRAAAQLSALVDRPAGAKAAAINASTGTVAEHYLRRAGALRELNADGWVHRSIPIDNTVSGEAQLAALADGVRAYFADTYGCESDEEIKGRLRDVEDPFFPYLLVIPDAAPRSAVFKELEDTFEGIHVVLLTGQKWPHDRGHIDFIVPEIGPGEETRVIEGCEQYRVDIDERRKKGEKRRHKST